MAGCSLQGGVQRGISTCSAVIRSGVTCAGGRSWSDTALYHPLIRLQVFSSYFIFVVSIYERITECGGMLETSGDNSVLS